MYVDADKVAEIIGNHPGFESPFRGPRRYYICSSDSAEQDENIPVDAVELYWQKLAYAVEHTAELFEKAFQPDFYNFYGVKRDKLVSPEEMCRQLVFDSFVLFVKEREIGACLSNSNFMFGHFIEARWDDEWNLIYSGIC